MLFLLETEGLGALTCVTYMQQVVKYNAHTVKKSSSLTINILSYLCYSQDNETTKRYKTNIYRSSTQNAHRYPNYNKTTIIKRQHNLEQENLLNLNCSSRCHHSAHVDERFGYTYVCCLFLQLLFDKKSPLSFKCYLYKPITLIYSLFP